MKINIALIILLFVISSAGSCKKNNTRSYSPIPAIEFRGVNQTTVRYTQQDTLIVQFSFVDGDGDLGQNIDNSGEEIYITDMRTGTPYGALPFPYIGEEAREYGYLIGSVDLKLFAGIYLLPRTDDSGTVILPDSTFFEIYIKDAAGNVSNTITTPVIRILE